MSAEVEYTPLSPVYKSIKEGQALDEEIALEDFPSTKQSSDKDECCEKKSSKRGCFCRRNKKSKRSLIVRLCRCLSVTVLVGLTLWLITGAAMLTYIGAKTHRCVHPRHSASQAFEWVPATLSTLELGVVSGTLNIRSCPYAKNVSLTVHTYAGTEELLNTMVLQRETIATGGERLVLLAPSFDFTHCQRAVFDVIVPEGAGLDIKAQGLLARVDVHAAKSAVHNLVVSTSVAHVDIHSSELSGDLRIDSELGIVKHRDVTVQGDIRTELRTGYLSVKNVVAEGTHSSVVRIGVAKLYHVEAKKEFTHASEIAHVSMWGIDTPSLKSRVDYGVLIASPDKDFAGHFTARSPYGFLKATHGHVVGSRFTVEKETLALIEGSVKPKTEATASDSDSDSAAAAPVTEVARSITLDALYGRVELFVPDPETKSEKAHSKEHSDKKPHH